MIQFEVAVKYSSSGGGLHFTIENTVRAGTIHEAIDITTAKMYLFFKVPEQFVGEFTISEITCKPFR